jgi:hypothetical protein
MREAIKATQNVLNQFVNRIYQLGMQEGLSVQQIMALIQGVQAGPAVFQGAGLVEDFSSTKTQKSPQ